MKSLAKLSVLALSAAGLLFAGLSSNVLAHNFPANVKLAPNQSLSFNVPQYPATIDPSLISYIWESQIIDSVFEPLVRQSWTGEYIPRGAASWSVSKDGLTWTFKLNPQAKWSDGKPVVAADWEYSFKRLVDPKTAATYGNYLELAHVKNAHDVNAGKLPLDKLGVKAQGKDTLVITLDHPTPWLPRMLTLSSLVPLRKDIIDKYGSKWTAHLVGNGPYVISKNAFEDTIVLTKSNTYWDKNNVTIKDINMSFIKDPNAAYLGYEAGRYSSASIPGKFKDKALKQFPNDVRTLDSQAVAYMYFNPKQVPNPRVRKAFALLVDTNLITTKIMKQGRATTAMVPNNINGSKYIKESSYLREPMASRQQRAIKLLAEAGYTPDHPFKIVYTLTKSPNQQADIAMKDFVERGSKGALQLQFNFVEIKGWQLALNSGKFQALAGGWNADYDHVSTFLDLYRCNNVTLNHSGICQHKADALQDQAAKEKDQDKAAKLYAQAEAIYRNTFLAVPLWQQNSQALVRNNIRGYNPRVNTRYFADYFIVTPDSVKAAEAYENSMYAKAKKN